MMPGLNGSRSDRCVFCGSQAQFFCARCEVTPYCSEGCQRRDWPRRHNAVCHNLARLSSPVKEIEMPPAMENLPTIPALRRPRSPSHESTRNGYIPNKNNDGPSRMANRFNNQRNDDRRQGYVRRDDNRQGQGQGRQPSDRYEPRRFNNRADSSMNGGSNYSNNYVHGRRPPLKHEMRNQENGFMNQDAQIPPKSPPRQVDVQDNEVKISPDIVAAATPAPRLNRAPKVDEKPLVPAKCLIDLLEIDSIVMISCDHEASKCRVEDGQGFVCLSLHEHFTDSYNILCGDYAADCEKLPEGYTPSPGDLFSLFVAAEGAWYRARLLSSRDNSCALIDSGVVCTAAHCREIPARYCALPEFCCLLIADGVKLEDRLRCRIESRSCNGECTVHIENMDTQETRKGVLKRWQPIVESQAPAANTLPTPFTNESASPLNQSTASVSQSVPEVPRPDLVANSEVNIIDIQSTDSVTVRRIDDKSKREFDMIEQNIALIGRVETPLKWPPTKGDVVLALNADGIHYRALITRTSVKNNKYQLEYVESGAVEVSTLEKLFECPMEYHLDLVPAVSSKMALANVEHALSASAQQYLKGLQESNAPLILTLPDGAKSAPSGLAALLTACKNMENINKRVADMCKPEWKKIEENGGNILDTEVLLVDDLEYLDIKPNEPLKIMDTSLLSDGLLAVCPSHEAAVEHMAYVLGPLTERMTEYCESRLGRDPYLPRDEELCIAQFPPQTEWYRAVKLESPGGPGSDKVTVQYVDYGNVANVDTRLLRRMLPEYVRGAPAITSIIEIQGFPDKPSHEVLAKIRELLGATIDGPGGVVTATALEKLSPGTYRAVVPSIIKAIKDL